MPVTENWHPMWGLWLVVSTPEAHQHQAAAACQPASANLKDIQKSSPFDKTTAVNV